jgi:SAM-dependent methyltransferase
MDQPRFDSERVLASTPAMGALGDLVGLLRSIDYANELRTEGAPAHRAAVRLALGHTVERAEMAESSVHALAAAGAVDVDGDVVVPRFALFASGSTYILLPRDDGVAPDRVYFGMDSIWLADVASRVGPGRGTAADLGTGAGTAAALLANTYDRVVATDLLPRTAAAAAITLLLNQPGRTRSASLVCVADIAGGLRPGAFDLVTANPPWVPAREAAVPAVFATGGPTGFELPRRFVVEAASLLAPGGVAVILAIDVTWRDGTQPLPALARGLRRLGLEVAILPTDATSIWRAMGYDLMALYDEMVAVDHVVLMIQRPPSPERLEHCTTSTIGAQA